MKVGDKALNPNGETVEIIAILPDTAGSWVDVGEMLFFAVNSATGVEVGPYTEDQIEGVRC